MRTAIRTVLAPIGVATALVVMSIRGDVFGQAASCGMQRNDAPVAFCETFDRPSPVTNRAGQLNGVLWGVSRLSGSGMHWKESNIDACGGSQAASPVGATDVIVCNGQLRESTDDDHDVTVLAMYPKQPFDFADRTGTVAFDVSNDTGGIHATWPEFWITDQPVPAPFSHSSCAFCSLPRHGVGIRFGADRGTCPGGWRGESVVVVRNYVAEERQIFENNTTGVKIRETGCASLSTGPNGGLNHVEIRLSQNRIEVYATDAGTTSPLRLINTITDANLSLTRGLVWIEDAHYNAEKGVAVNGVPSQKNHTYAWDNLAFDGPRTYRDLSYDVIDKRVPLGGGVFDLGWNTTPQTAAALTTLPIGASDIAAARNALLLFNFGVYTVPKTFNYSVNGHPSTAASPIPATVRGMRSVALPVELSYLVPGQQNIELSSDTDMTVSNISLVLVAAASVPGVPGSISAPSAPANFHILRNIQ